MTKRNSKKRFGFTLIELLVVVLIIGILSAIALPYYQKSVWMSRATQLQTLVRSLGEAQNSYYMANSSWPTQFSDLDWGFDFAASGNENCGLVPLSASDGTRYGKNFYLVLNGAGGAALSAAVFTEGPYRCSGFTFMNKHDTNSFAQRLYCWERASGSSETPEGVFCRDMFGGTKITSIGSYNIYDLP